MAKAATTASLKEQELNRWAIEMAMRWPVVQTGGYGAAVGQFGQMPRHEVDADVIGRATKLISWIKQEH